VFIVHRHTHHHTHTHTSHHTDTKTTSHSARDGYNTHTYPCVYSTQTHTHTSHTHRYGDDITKRKRQRAADVKELLQVDQFKRELAMMSEVRQIRNILQGKRDSNSQSSSEDHESFVLSITIKAAEDLPKMDVLYGIDSYCVVSVDGLQDEVYQTKVVLKDKNPVWDANFEWTVPGDARLVTIAVIDHDTVTEDDLVR
jgi:Ca2+-dependent lipid-binding protein